MSNLCWQFAQVDFPTVLAMCYSLLPFMHSKCVFVCIIAVQYNCYMLVCISMHFYYIVYVYN